MIYYDRPLCDICKPVIIILQQSRPDIKTKFRNENNREISAALRLRSLQFHLCLFAGFLLFRASSRTVYDKFGQVCNFGAEGR